MNNIKAWWASLSTKEQRLVMLAGAFVVFGIIYWGIWSPLNSAIEQQQRQLNKQQQLLSWMKDNGAALATTSGASSQPASKQSLAQVINATARNKQIKLSRVQPKGDELQVMIDAVAFNQLVRWMELLQNRYKVTVVNADLMRADEKGIVNVKRLQFKRQ